LTPAGFANWKTRARNLAQVMEQSLPPGHLLGVTSIVKPGEHSKFEKMDVVPRGDTTWEELAYAAARAGFWVHAEGVTLCGKYWPRSAGATGSHLDLYHLKPNFRPPMQA
jgi:hypothetical protein